MANEGQFGRSMRRHATLGVRGPIDAESGRYDDGNLQKSRWCALWTHLQSKSMGTAAESTLDASDRDSRRLASNSGWLRGYSVLHVTRDRRWGRRKMQAESAMRAMAALRAIQVVTPRGDNRLARHRRTRASKDCLAQERAVVRCESVRPARNHTPGSAIRLRTRCRPETGR